MSKTAVFAVWRGHVTASRPPAGVERITRIGYFGVSYSYLESKVENNGGTGEIGASQHELGLFWRRALGPFYAFARLSVARASFSSERSFIGTADSTEFGYANSAKWNGWLYSGAAGASYGLDVGRNFTLRPRVLVDYYRLSEKGYSETGGGEAMDLTVGGRTSTALTATTSLALSYRFGPRSRDSRPLAIELEGGRRTVLSGSLGTTRASFEDADPFTITPDDLKSGWITEARVLAGGYDFTWKVSARAEEFGGNINYSGRASLSVAF